jgi:AcrR family transcriptional regulator
MYKNLVRTFNPGMQLRVAAPPMLARRTAAAPKRDRRQAILLAAEKLFAQSGYRAVTIRQIAGQAQVPLALVGYYFGPKHELFHAIFEHWRHTIDERVALLHQAQAGKAGAEALRRIVTAFVEPVLRLRASAEGEYYAQLVSRELSYRTPEIDRVLGDFFDPMAHDFIDALHHASPGCTRGQAAWAYQFALGVLIHHINDHRVQTLSRGKNKPNDPAAGAMLVDFIVAGIGAVLQAKPSRSPIRNRSRRQP